MNNDVSTWKVLIQSQTHVSVYIYIHICVKKDLRKCKPAETLRAAGTGFGAAAFTLAPDVFGIGGWRGISKEPEEVVPGIALAAWPANFGGVNGEADEVTGIAFAAGTANLGGVNGEADEVTGIAFATGTANLGGVEGEADEVTGIVFATGPAMGGAEGDADVFLHGAFAPDPNLGGAEGDADVFLHGAFAPDPNLGGVEGDTDNIVVPVAFAGGPANAAGTPVIATLGPSAFLAAGTPPEAKPVAPPPTWAAALTNSSSKVFISLLSFVDPLASERALGTGSCNELTADILRHDEAPGKFTQPVPFKHVTTSKRSHRYHLYQLHSFHHQNPYP